MPDSFPIARSNCEREHNGVYLAKALILGYMNALAAGEASRIMRSDSSGDYSRRLGRGRMPS